MRNNLNHVRNLHCWYMPWQRNGRDFRLVFRTFGLDLLEIAQEFNAFCEGQHPCFGDVRLDHDPDLRVKLPWQAGKPAETMPNAIDGATCW